MLKKTLFIGLALMGVIMINSVNAQHSNCKSNKNPHSMCAIPDLTEDQLEKM